MKVFTNPKVQIPSGIHNEDDSGTVYSDGTFLHRDIILERIVKNLTPLHIYNENTELINSFVKTLVNYSPVSINIMDFWNKRSLEPFCIPINKKELENIPEDKMLRSNTKEAFFINAIKNLQEQLARMYMGNVYNVAYRMKNDHRLRQQLLYIFRQFDIEENDKTFLFDRINELFKEERFITNKTFNMRKGKTTALRYATKSAWEAKIEGAMTTSDFDFEFFDYTNDTSGLMTGPFEYKVESVILKDIYNAFVRPLAHPLGMIDDYKKVCLAKFDDRVLSKLRWRCSVLTVKCTHPSTESPIVITPRDHGYEINPDYDDTLPECSYEDTKDPNNTDCFGKQQNEKLRRILSHPGERIVTENVQIDDTLWGPWDPRSKTDEKVIAFDPTLLPKDHPYQLWDEIRIWDKDQGNILKDIVEGYGDHEYSGMQFKKYVFENDSYLIDYYCQDENGKDKHIIEYYRYDELDTSVYYNLYSINSLMPPFAYQEYKKDDQGYYLDHDDRRISTDNWILDPQTGDYIRLNGTLQQGNGLVPIKTLRNIVHGEGLTRTFVYSKSNSIPNYELVQPKLAIPNKPAEYVWSPSPIGTATREESRIVFKDISSVPLNSFVSVTSYTGTEPDVIKYSTKMQMNESEIFPEDSNSNPVPDIDSYVAAVYVYGLRISPENYELKEDRIVFKNLPPPIGTKYTIDVTLMHNTKIRTDIAGKKNRPPFGPEDTWEFDITPNKHEIGLWVNGRYINERWYETINDKLIVHPRYVPDPDAPDGTYKSESIITMGEEIIIQENPVNLNTQTFKLPSWRDPDTPEEEYRTFRTGYKSKSVDVFSNGALTDPTSYDYVHEDNTWNTPWNDPDKFKWDKDTNLYTTNVRVTPIYSLVARWNANRGCIVNAYQLRKMDVNTVQDQMMIHKICYDKNIVIDKAQMKDYKDRNIYNRRPKYETNSLGQEVPVFDAAGNQLWEETNIFNNRRIPKKL